MNALLVIRILATFARAQEPSLSTGDWVGQFVKHDSSTFIHVRFASDGSIGRADLPQNNLWDVKVFDVRSAGDSLSFLLALRGDTARFAGEARRDGINGTLAIRGEQLPLELIHRMAYDSSVVRPLAGNYRIARDRVISMGPMDEADGWLSFFDSKTRRGGILYALSDSVFFTGATFGLDYPIAIRARVHRSASGKVSSLTWMENGSPPRDATRIDDYVQENIAFTNDAVRLVGNLTTPKGAGPHPAVILIHGCCGILPTRDFGYWSTYLAGKGIAVLAYDRRGGGESTGDPNTATYEDIADDVLAGLALLETRKDIDSRRIGFFGMSNGGYIAPLAAARSHGRVAFIAVRSGSAQRVGDNIAYEVANDLRSEGFSERDVARAVTIRQRVTDFVIARPSISVPAWDSLRAEVTAVSGEKWFPWARVMWVPRVSPVDSFGLAFLNSLRASWRYDPIPDWRLVRVPVYIMLGGLDRSVPTAESAKLFRATFAAAGVKNATVRVFPAGNHGLLEARTGFQRETHALGYYVAGFQEDLVRWIQRVGRPVKKIADDKGVSDF